MCGRQAIPIHYKHVRSSYIFGQTGLLTGVGTENLTEKPQCGAPCATHPFPCSFRAAPATSCQAAMVNSLSLSRSQPPTSTTHGSCAHAFMRSFTYQALWGCVGYKTVVHSCFPAPSTVPRTCSFNIGSRNKCTRQSHRLHMLTVS